MVGWHHQLSGHEFEQTPGDSDGQGRLGCCGPWGRKELDITEQQQRQLFSKAPHTMLFFLLPLITPQYLPLGLSVCVQSLQSYLILCHPMARDPPGSSVRGIFPARILEWVGISYFSGSSQPRNRTSVSSISYTAGGFFTAEPPGKP